MSSVAVLFAREDSVYGINVTKMNMGSRKTAKPSAKKWDEHPPDERYFEEIKRVSKARIIWGGVITDAARNNVLNEMTEREVE